MLRLFSTAKRTARIMIYEDGTHSAIDPELFAKTATHMSVCMSEKRYQRSWKYRSTFSLQREALGMQEGE